MLSIFNNLAPLKLSKDPCDIPTVAIKKKHTIVIFFAWKLVSRIKKERLNKNNKIVWYLFI